MNDKKIIYRASGFSLMEMLISLAIFGILMAILYPTFESVSNKVNELSDKQALTQKGQRVMDYMGEEFRLVGLFVGATPSITFCGAANVDSLMHTDGAGTSSDQVAFLSSERIRTTRDLVPYLITAGSATLGAASIEVNVSKDYAKAIERSTSTTNNGRAFITFDTLQPNLGILVYEVTDFVGSILTLSPPLDQRINAQSNAYLVVRKRFTVDASRNLQLQKWKENCASDNSDIVTAHGAGNLNGLNGGVDGFQVEYGLANGAIVSALTSTNIQNVRNISFWVLFRSDFPSKSYVNQTVYALGTSPSVTIPAFNDNYRRVLLTKTVEVKNASL